MALQESPADLLQILEAHMATSEVDVAYKADTSGKTMKAAVWIGNFKVEVQDKPKPVITNKVRQC